MKLRSFPYHRAPEESVKSSEWFWRSGSEAEWQPVEPFLEHWDYQTPTTFFCEVEVDIDAIRSSCSLPKYDSVALISTWSASATARSGVGSRDILPASGRTGFQIEFSVPSNEVAGRLTLERFVVLLGHGTSENPLSPTKSGSKLWEEPAKDRLVVALDGDASRFPTEALDFGEAAIASPDAVWFLDLELSDLDRNASAAMRLYLNSAHPVVGKILSATQGDAAMYAQSTLRWDVAMTMVGMALDSDEFCERSGSFDEDSIGHAIELLIRRIYKDEPAAVVELRSQHPAVYRARGQAGQRLFGGVT